MYRIILFLILVNTVYSLNIEANTPIKSKFFLHWINKNFYVDEKKDITIILYENNKGNKYIFNKINFNKKIYKISSIKIENIGIKKGSQIEFVSPWEKTTYIWREKNKIYINGDDFFYNKSLENILLLYLKRELGDVFLDKNIEQAYKKKSVNLSIITNLLLLILGVGTIILIYIIRKSIKNGYGDPFKK